MSLNHDKQGRVRLHKSHLSLQFRKLSLTNFEAVKVKTHNPEITLNFTCLRYFNRLIGRHEEYSRTVVVLELANVPGRCVRGGSLIRRRGNTSSLPRKNQVRPKNCWCETPTPIRRGHLLIHRHHMAPAYRTLQVERRG